MDNVYVVQKVDGRDKIVVGVFAAHGLAEIARDQYEAKLSEQDVDAGVFFRITAFELGKVY